MRSASSLAAGGKKAADKQLTARPPPLARRPRAAARGAAVESPGERAQLPPRAADAAVSGAAALGRLWVIVISMFPTVACLGLAGLDMLGDLVFSRLGLGWCMGGVEMWSVLLVPLHLP